MAHTHGEFPPTYRRGDNHTARRVVDLASVDPGGISRVHARGVKSILEGVVWQMTVEASDLEVMAIMEGSLGS